MKKRTIFAGLINCVVIVTLAQQPVNNFSIYEGKMIWQKVFETDVNFDQIARSVKETGILRDIEISGSKISGQAQLIEPDFAGLGYGEMSVPIFIARNFVECFALIEFKEGRYRVTLRNIILTQKYNDGLSKEGEKSSIEWYALNSKNEIKKSFNKKPSEILDYTFTKSFTFTQPDRSDEW